MALCTLSVSRYEWDNTQKRIMLYGTLVISPSNGTYPVGGIPLDSVLLAIPEVTCNNGKVKFFQAQSAAGSGYIYQRIDATGTLMVLQVPPNGSLTTAAPLQQIPSSLNMQGVCNDTINFQCSFLRNA